MFFLFLVLYFNCYTFSLSGGKGASLASHSRAKVRKIIEICAIFYQLFGRIGIFIVILRQNNKLHSEDKIMATAIKAIPTLHGEITLQDYDKTLFNHNVTREGIAISGM